MKSKSPNTNQQIGLLKQLGLDSHPAFAAAIQESTMTGNSARLNQLITEQMPAIQQMMMQTQYEAQLAEQDPFYPRPTAEMFAGNIPIAMIPDLFGQEPSMFVQNIEDLMQHAFVCGSSGSGKTRGILSTIRTLKSALGNNLTIWVFEPKKSFRQFLYPDFKILTYQDMRDNLFEPPTSKMPDFNWRSIVTDLLGREQQFQIGSKNQLMETLREIKPACISYPSNAMILEKLKSSIKKAGSFRESDPIISLINRFNALTEYDAHSRNVIIPIKDLKKIDAVIELGDATIENDKFRTSMLLSRLYHYKKHNRPKDGKHYNLIIIDEGRELFSQTKSGFGESILEMMFALSREMDIGFIVSTQEPKSVSNAIKSNVKTMIAFPLSEGKERKDIAQSLSLTPDQMEYYQSLSAFGHGHAIAKYGRIAAAFPIQFPDIADPARPITQTEIDAHNTAFLERYKIPEKVVPIRPQPPQPPPPLISKDEERLMRIINDNPLEPVTRIYGIFGINPKDANEIKNALLNKGYVIQDTVKIKKKGKPNVFMRLTPDACQQLNIRSNAWNKPGIKHEIYSRLVKLNLETEGWTCSLEGQVSNHPHKMDVLAVKAGERHDYEITIHLKNIQDNINAALGAGLVNKVIIVSDNDDIEKCRTKTALEQSKFGTALEFKPISDFYI